MADLEIPVRLRKPFFELFSMLFKVNLEEVELPLTEYPTLNSFFVRKLKSAARPISTSTCISPSDSKFLNAGSFNDEQCEMHAIKGKSFRLPQLVGKGWDLNKYLQGGYGIFYLSPPDYHYFHAPISGEISRLWHIPGDLWPVNGWSIKNIDGVFCCNERVVLEINGLSGSVLMVFVGATNVGKIEINLAPQIQTNLKNKRNSCGYRFSHSVSVNKGQELGRFRLGSTVVMVVDSKLNQQWKDTIPFLLGTKVNMGQGLSG